MTTTLDFVREAFKDAGEASMSHGVLVLRIPSDDVLSAARRLKSVHGFDLLLDVTAVDWLDRVPRFDVVYHFYSTGQHVRVRVKIAVPANAPVVPSVTSLYGSAAFMERECHDMYGITFEGNADQRPILLYEGFEGHPLRKDYAKTREQPLVPYLPGH
jgi:NADH-quinone oxidoreductase subunit C